MAKGRMPAMGGMGGMNMNAMLRQAQKMQENMEKARAELDAKEYEFSAGGGAVTAKVNGKKEVLALDIKPEVIDPEDAEMLADMVIAAVNGALTEAAKDAEEQMKKLTGGMSMPGMF